MRHHIVNTLLTITAVLALTTTGGCATATEDRGSWGDQRQQTPQQIGNFAGIDAPSPTQDADSQDATVVARALDAKLTELREALVIARENGDTGLVASITQQITQLENGKAVAASGGQFFFVGGDLHVTTVAEGDSSAESPGDSTQTPTGPETTAEVPVNVTPGSGG